MKTTLFIFALCLGSAVTWQLVNLICDLPIKEWLNARRERKRKEQFRQTFFN